MTSGHRWNLRQSQQRVNNGKAKYEYKYGVKDIDTGDTKQQWEYRDGDQVKGKISELYCHVTKFIVIFP